MISLDDITARLEAVKRMGQGYVARCPAHDDKVASLKLDAGTDGRPLIFCHAGCSFEDIVQALSLEVKDLLPEKETPLRLEDAVKVYDYRNDRGEVVFKVARFVPKTFRPFHREGRAWKPGMGDANRIPYHLPEILEARKAGKWIAVCEGEKDADVLMSLGMPAATTNPAGAGKWDEAWSGYFVDAFVAIFPDNDEPGRDHAYQVARSLHGVARQVKVVELPGVPDKGDVSDYIKAGHGYEDIKSLIRAAPVFTGRRRDTNLVVTRVSEVVTEMVRWLWHRYLPLGKLCTLEGDPGQGKSSITLDLAARVSTCTPMPDGDRSQEDACDVLLFTSEDDVADTVRPRLEAAEADLDRIHVVSAIKADDGERLIQIPQDIERMEELISDYGIQLVVVDPLVAYIEATIDSHRDQDVRRALHPLKEMAHRTGACVLLMRHLNKGGGNAMYRGGGSIGITGQVRLGMVAANHPTIDDQRILAVYKSNLERVPESQVYRLVPADLTGAARVKWLGPSTLTADDVLNPPKRARQRSILEEDA